MDRPVIDLAPLFDDVDTGKITLVELANKLDEYGQQARDGAIGLCYKGIPIITSKYLMPEADIKH